jgi:hypothetical protein
MALRAVPDHPKFADLKQRLGLPKYATLGILEAIWHFTGRFTPQGNIGKYPDSVIEAWAEWQGEPGAMVSALLQSRWVDADEEFRILVHDWDQHADKATKTALARSKRDFCTPNVPTLFTQCTDSVLPEGGLPVPVPVPEPVPVPVPVPVPDKNTTLHKTSELELQEEICKVGVLIQKRHPAIRSCGISVIKAKLQTIVNKLPASQRAVKLASINENHALWCATESWIKENGQYAKALENWLAPTMGRFEDPPPVNSRNGFGGQSPVIKTKPSDREPKNDLQRPRSPNLLHE